MGALTRIAAPSGTVTMLFTDIEGSSKAVRTIGADRWVSVLERHDDIIREGLTRHSGFEVRTEGDSFFAVFASPGAAVAAAAMMQRRLGETEWPSDAPMRVRMGLHTGEVRTGAGGVDYAGFEISRAARIAAAGYGRQALVAGTTEAHLRAQVG